MQRELSKYFVSLVKLFLHTIFRSNGLKNKVPKVLNLYYPRENHLQPLLSCDHQGGVGGFPAGKVPGPIFTIKLFWFAVGVSIHRGNLATIFGKKGK